MDIPKPTRLCCVSGRELAPGEDFFSALVEDDYVVRRLDYAPEHWSGPPENRLGWWKTRLPEAGEKKARLAPNDILLNLFAEWQLQPEKTDMLYVLTLLLIRRRLLRYEREDIGDDGVKRLVVYALKENSTFEIPVVMPEAERLRDIQEQLSQLLYS